jgi:hypothetical protein
MGYEHTQKGNPWFYWGIPVIVICPFLAVMIVMKISEYKPESVAEGGLLGGLALAFYITIPVAIWAGLFMSRLKVWIDAEFVRVRFGCGTWWKKFPLNKIQSAAPVRNDWSMGWGIHYVGNGWLYNIAGMEAVELTFKNGKKARIGTDEPEKLAAAIQAVLR